MENAESLVNKTAEIHEIASEIVRMITGAQMPEFSSENMSVADASKLIGLPAAAIRAGIVYRWLIYWTYCRPEREVCKRAALLYRCTKRPDICF